MKLLHVSSWPGPPFNGGNINRYHFLKWLADRYHCKFIMPRWSDQDVDITQEGLCQLGISNEGVSVVEIPEIKLADRFRGIISSSLPPGVHFMERAMGPDLREATRRVLDEWKPDAIVIWSGNLASILHSLRCVPRVLYACDSMSVLNLSIAQASRSLTRKCYNRIVARRYAAFERKFLSQYDEVVFISKRDAEQVALPPPVSVTVIGNGVDTNQLKPVERSPSDRNHCVLMFHGYLGYVANDECVRFLVHTLGPAMVRQFGEKGFSLRIVGHGATDALRSLEQGRPWLRFDGYQDDLGATLSSADIYVAPLAMGAGVKNKVLEAMACGLPVVGTPEAFNGLMVKPGTHVVSCPRDRFASEIAHLASDRSRRISLGRQARQLVTENCSWDAAAAMFENVVVRASALRNKYVAPRSLA